MLMITDYCYTKPLSLHTSQHSHFNIFKQKSEKLKHLIVFNCVFDHFKHNVDVNNRTRVPVVSELQNVECLIYFSC